MQMQKKLFPESKKDSSLKIFFTKILSWTSRFMLVKWNLFKASIYPHIWTLMHSADSLAQLWHLLPYKQTRFDVFRCAPPSARPCVPSLGVPNEICFRKHDASRSDLRFRLWRLEWSPEVVRHNPERSTCDASVLAPGVLVQPSSCCAAPAGPLREQHLTGPSRRPPARQLSGGITPCTWDPVTLTPPHPTPPPPPPPPHSGRPLAGDGWRWASSFLLPFIFLSFKTLLPSLPLSLPLSSPPSSVMFSAVPCRQGSLTECLLCYGFIGLVCGRNLWIKVISHCSTFSQAVKLPFTFVPLAERDRERHM